MKKRLVLISFIVISALSFSNPPTAVDMKFDEKTKKLKVDVTHLVPNEERHFIEKITIKLNGKTIIDQYFKSQTDKKEQEAEYTLIDAKKGDFLEVEAECNINGSKKVRTRL